MISIPPESAPSLLLQLGKMKPAVRTLLESCRAARAGGDWSQAESSAETASNLCLQQNDRFGYAVALLHLSDVYREVGRLGPALKHCERAYQIFHRQPARGQRLNEAAAAYGMGLLHLLLGSEVDALDWFQRAQELFETVQHHRAVAGDAAGFKRYGRVSNWIKNLSDGVAAFRARTVGLGARPYLPPAWLPVLPLQRDEADYPVVELEITDYVAARELLIEGQPFCPYSVTGGRKASLKLRAGAEHFTLKVPEDNWAGLPTGVGDYVLVCREDKKKPGPGVAWAADNEEWALGEFKRDPATGEIRFVPLKPRVIGDDAPHGSIIAILKPI